MKRVWFLVLVCSILLLVGCTDKQKQLQNDLEKADAAYTSGDFETAIEYYSEALKIDQDNAVIYNNRGLAYSETGARDEAIEDFKQAAALEENAVYQGNLGSVYMDLNKYPEAIEAYSEAIRLDEENGLYYLGRAYAYGASGEDDLAVADFKEAQLRGQNDGAENAALILNNQGTELYDQEAYEEACQKYTQAIELSPHNPVFYWNRAEAFRNQGMDQEALEDYLKHLELSPENANKEIYARIGIEYILLESYDEALEYLESAREQDPDDPALQEYIADIYYQQEQWEEAETLYTTILEERNDAILFAKRGDCYFHMGKYKKAVKDLTEAISINDKYAWAYYMRAESYMKLEKYDAARKDYKKAEKLK